MKKIGIFMVMFLLMISLAMAATFNTPGSGEVILGSAYTVNVTSTLSDIVNCTVTASSALAGDSLSSTTLLNSTGVIDELNATIDTTALTDASDWIFTGTCTNSTPSTETITAVTAIVDNTQPTCAFASALVGNAAYPPRQVWSITGTNAVSSTIQFGSNTIRTMDGTTGNDVFTYSEQVTEAIYSAITAVTSDGRNLTSCAINNVEIDSDSTAKQVATFFSAEGAKQKQQGNSGTMVLFLAAIVGIVLFRKNKN